MAGDRLIFLVLFIFPFSTGGEEDYEEEEDYEITPRFRSTSVFA